MKHSAGRLCHALHALIAVTFLLLNSSSCSASDAPLSPISLRQRPTGDRAFVDGSGRERIFHGVNAIVKGSPWHPRTDYFDARTSLTDLDFEILANLGMNTIRLGAMWPAIEPAPSQYNYTYLEVLSGIVASAARHGIYTLLDMHQDVLSEVFCGEGIPAWAVRTTGAFPFPQFAGKRFTEQDYESSSGYAFPTRQACARHDWPTYHGSDAVGVAFEALYTDAEIVHSWARMWAVVARFFRGRSEVLGLELINEPWAGDVYRHPSLLVPGNADRKRLQPAYDLINSYIRLQDDQRLIFFGAVTWADFGSGFEHGPGGAAYSNRSVFSFHYYEPPQLKHSMDFHMRRHRAGAMARQTGLMLTEFSAPGSGDSFADTAAAADKHLTSWMFWEWKPFCRETEETLASPSQTAAWGACKTGYGSVD
eukprot:GILI01017074.1.p1 GENE.GILI01017074.1~~GILI01017074.1.p1  ORF type:complete len:422 (-),score=92.93 GILI01017074.1:41-1306(-)